MAKVNKMVEVDVINRVSKEDIGRYIHHANELGYHVKVEPVIYEQEAIPLAGIYHDTEQIRYQITLLKEVDE